MTLKIRTYLSKAAFAQHFNELKVFYVVFPEARYGPRWGRKSSRLAEKAVSCRLLCKEIKHLGYVDE